MDVRGNATVSVSLRQDEADCGTDDLPFSFDVTLHRDGSLAAVRDLTVETATPHLAPGQYVVVEAGDPAAALSCCGACTKIARQVWRRYLMLI